MFWDFFGTLSSPRCMLFHYFIIFYIITYSFSLLFCSDGETFISADDLRINLWNLEISNQSFNIVDVKPANMEDLTGENFEILHENTYPSSFKMFLVSVV